VIALIDYGAGNLTSVRKGFAAVGAEIYTPETPRDLDRARAIVVPGVGNFAATAALQGPWTETIRDAVAAGVPLLGVCVGLQWLFEGSDEAPEVVGLGAIKGKCSRLPQTDGIKVPHVGWNSLHVPHPSRLLAGVAEDAQVYFTHSYAAPVTKEAAATCEHGAVFAAAIESDNIFGVQFHPEKSSAPGLRILRNFIGITREADHALKAAHRLP
jgi:imidazole glycerol-phosphate synthase subunit HisH